MSNPQMFAVKIRAPIKSGDKPLKDNGHKKEIGGRIFTRHFEANNYNHAKTRAEKQRKRVGGTIISIHKVSPQSVIGDHRQWGLEHIIGKRPPKGDVITNEVTLDEIVFGTGTRRRHK